MNVVEKRDFIHSHLHQAEEQVINEFYEILREKDLLKLKLESRALKSETDINSGHVFSRDEVEKSIGNINRK